MEYPDRDQIVSLLGRLGESDDSEVLGAARQLHEMVTESGAAWDDLLAPSDTATEEPPAEPVDLEDTAALSLLETLLVREDLSDEMREELEGYKADIAEGEFTDDDRRYLIALETRL
jgi:hypothetical protein